MTEDNSGKYGIRPDAPGTGELKIDHTVKMDTMDLSALDSLEPVTLSTLTSISQKVGVEDSANENDDASRTARITTRIITDLFTEKQDVDDEIQEKLVNADKGDIVKNSEPISTMGELKDKFTLQNKFAEGGQGILKQAMDLNLKRLVAIKSLRPELCPDEKQRSVFISEAQVTAQLEHPAIIPIYSIHSENGKGLALAMKMVHGQNFKDYLDQVAKLYRKNGFQTYDERKSLRYRLEIFLKISDALEYAHSRNIMHCDLKPENIMIGDYNEAYLMDWGISRQIHDPEYDPATWKKPDTVIGTPRFLSPEAIAGEYTDERADIYAMGLILYEVATLTEAYNGVTAAEIAAKVRHHKMRPVDHKFGAHIDSDLKAIILKAAAPDRNDRYASMTEMNADLRLYLRNEEVSCNPDSPLRKIIRWSKFHAKATVIIAMACLLAALGSMAYNLAGQIRTERMENSRHQALTNSFIICTDTVYKFDQRIADIRSCLNELAASAELLLELSCDTADAGNALIPWEQYKMTGAAQKNDTTEFGMNLDFEHIAVLTQKDTRPGSTQKEALKIALLKNEMRSAMANMNGSIRNICFAFQDGLFLAYPAGCDYSGFDARSRQWYRSRIGAGSPKSGWNTPYMDIDPAVGMVITCSYRLEDSNGNRLGVAAVDLSVNRAASDLFRNISENDIILESTFIDEHGNIIITDNASLRKDGAEYYKNHPDGGISAFPYPDKELTEKVRSQKVGYETRFENGREVVYMFKNCDSVDWFMILKFDLEKFAEFMREHNK